jgi:flagellin
MEAAMITSVSSPTFTRTREIASSDRSAASEVAVSNSDISRLTDTDLDKEILNRYIKAVDDALSELTLSASVVGATKSRIEGNNANLIDSNTRGIGQLVDADLSEEAAKMKALQTQDQLAIQTLEISNSGSQNLLRILE